MDLIAGIVQIPRLEASIHIPVAVFATGDGTRVPDIIGSQDHIADSRATATITRAGEPPAVFQIDAGRALTDHQRITESIRDLADPDLRLLKEDATFFQVLATHTEVRGETDGGPIPAAPILAIDRHLLRHQDALIRRAAINWHR